MKKAILFLFSFLALSVVSAQNAKNNNADAILGTYRVNHGGHITKVKVVKTKSDTYNAQCIWVKDSIDPTTGKYLTDSKNPDKKMRSTPMNKVILFKGISYNTGKHCWDGGKVYDPTRGINANCTIEFVEDGRLKVKGSLMGISETSYWTLIK